MDIESLLNEQIAPTGTAGESMSRKSNSPTSTTRHSPNRSSRDPLPQPDAAQSSASSDPKLLPKPQNTNLDVNSMATHADPPQLPYYNQHQTLYMQPPPSDTTDPNLAPPPYVDSSANQDAPPPFRSSRQTSQSSERSLECNICHKRFSRRSDLVRHERIHSGDRPHPCPQLGCGKSFVQRSALTVHMRVHTGEKPHLCDQCSKPFSDSSSLARHRRTHTGARPYKCTYVGCDKDFTRRTTLKRHVEQAHSVGDQLGQSEPGVHENGGISNIPLQQVPQQPLQPIAERPRKRQTRNAAAFQTNPDFQHTLGGLPPDQNLTHQHPDNLSPQQHHSSASPTSYPMPGRSSLADAMRAPEDQGSYGIQDQSHAYKQEVASYPPLDDEYPHIQHSYYQQPPKPLAHGESHYYQQQPKPLDPNDNNYYANSYEWQQSGPQCKNGFGNGWVPR